MGGSKRIEKVVRDPDHFKWHGPRILGLTSVGRTTVRVLAMNHPVQVNTRRALIAEGRFPPSP
jgi:hypothetical protein